jgi:hypothetical protein
MAFNPFDNQYGAVGALRNIQATIRGATDDYLKRKAEERSAIERARAMDLQEAQIKGESAIRLGEVQLAGRKANMDLAHQQAMVRQSELDRAAQGLRDSNRLAFDRESLAAEREAELARQRAENERIALARKEYEQRYGTSTTWKYFAESMRKSGLVDDKIAAAALMDRLKYMGYDQDMPLSYETLRRLEIEIGKDKNIQAQQQFDKLVSSYNSSPILKRLNDNPVPATSTEVRDLRDDINQRGGGYLKLQVYDENGEPVSDAAANAQLTVFAEKQKNNPTLEPPQLSYKVTVDYDKVSSESRQSVDYSSVTRTRYSRIADKIMDEVKSKYPRLSDEAARSISYSAMQDMVNSKLPSNENIDAAMVDPDILDEIYRDDKGIVEQVAKYKDVIGGQIKQRAAAISRTNKGKTSVQQTPVILTENQALGKQFLEEERARTLPVFELPMAKELENAAKKIDLQSESALIWKEQERRKAAIRDYKKAIGR